MTAEEEQQATFDALVAARKQKVDDIAIWNGLVTAQNAAAATASASYQKYLTDQKVFTDAQYKQFAQRTKIDIDDTVAIATASQAYNEAMQNHGPILT